MGLFGAQPDDIVDLGADRSVELVRKLLWAEADHQGVAHRLIRAPQCINVGDGGLDAVIDEADPDVDDLIPPGPSGFQVKSGSLGPTGCRRELHEREDLDAPLKDGVQRVMDQGGTYVLVLCQDLSDPLYQDRLSAIVDELETNGCVDPSVRLIAADQLLSYVERYPAIEAWLTGQVTAFVPYEIWSERPDARIPEIFAEDPAREAVIERIRELLRDPSATRTVIRVAGLSGLGKTRLVFEALSEADLANQAAYIPDSRMLSGEVMNQLQMDKRFRGTLVVDECSIDDHKLYERALATADGRIRVVTLSHEIGQLGDPTHYWELEVLAGDAVRTIIEHEFPGLPAGDVDRLVEFSDGYPNLAVILARSREADEGAEMTDLVAIDDEHIIRRLVGGHLDPTSERFAKHRRVLRWMSAFGKVGVAGDGAQEGRWLAERAGVTLEEFLEIVEQQRRRGILKGEYYAYVTPFVLAVHLSREWLSLNGGSDDAIGELVASMPDSIRADMFRRLCDRLAYVPSTDVGERLIEDFLGPSGPFSSAELLNSELGSYLFLRLTEANPRSALDCLDRVLSPLNRDELVELEVGRRNLVWALQRIVVWDELFQRGARHLLALAEAENESWSNNASGIFADLFSPAPGRVAPTEAPPSERFPIIVEAMDSGIKARQLLALDALDQAIEWGHFSRIVGPEFQGARGIPQLWTPSSGVEVVEYFRDCWEFLRNRQRSFSPDLRRRAIDVLLKSTRTMVTAHPSLSQLALETLEEVASMGWDYKKSVIKTVSSVVRYDAKRIDDEEAERWADFLEQLEGEEYGDKLRRYVGVAVIEDDIDSEGGYLDAVRERLRSLAQEGIEEQELLVEHIPWLVQTSVERAHGFGFELGRGDDGLVSFEPIRDATLAGGQAASNALLGGYLAGVGNRDSNQYEGLMQDLMQRPGMTVRLPELVSRTRPTDNVARALLEIASDGRYAVEELSVFRSGNTFARCSPETVELWIDFLLETFNEEGAILAVDIAAFKFVVGDSERFLDRALCERLLLHRAFINPGATVSFSQMTSHHWKELMEESLGEYTDIKNELLAGLLEGFSRSEDESWSLFDAKKEILRLISEQDPGLVWPAIAPYLGPPMDRRAFFLTQWLRGEKGWTPSEPAPLHLFESGWVWTWVEEDVGERAPYLASFVPPTLYAEDEPLLAREVLARYGEDERVRTEFFANYSTTSWAGPESKYLKSRIEELERIQELDENEVVLRWISEYIEHLRERIEKAEQFEELRGY